VAARRLIVVLLVLLVVSSTIAALMPVDDPERAADSSTSTTSTTSTPEREPPPAGELVRRTITAEAKHPKRIGVPPGTQLDVLVTSDELSDQVEIPALGEYENVNPDFPARFDLLLLERGDFDVRLVEAKRVIARILVAPEAKR
jgi:hypothetical protein